MKSKNIKKILLLVAVTILLVGLVSATSVNKTSDDKDTKIIKETKKPLKTQENKILKTTTKKNNTAKSTDNKATNKITTPKVVNNSISKKIPYRNSKNKNQTIKSSYYIEVTSKTVYGKTTYLEAELSPFCDDDAIVEFYIDEKYVGYKAVKDHVKLKYTFKDYGTYDYAACYSPFTSSGSSSSATITVKPIYTIKSNIPSSAITNKKTTLTYKLFNKTSKINTGQLRIKFNGKTIATKKVKDGKVKITYKMPKKPGNYKITAEYINKNKKIKTLNQNIYVDIYPILTKTLYFSRSGNFYETPAGYGDVFETYEAWSSASQHDEGAYVFLMYSGNKHKNPLIPYTYRFIKATFHHYNYDTSQDIFDTVKPGGYWRVDKYMTVKSKLRKNYTPMDVKVYYRKMTPSEKKYVIKYG